MVTRLCDIFFSKMKEIVANDVVIDYCVVRFKRSFDINFIIAIT